MSAVDVASERMAVIAEAETWLGTPFHHAVRVKGAGVDCAQLLIAVYGACGVTPRNIETGYYAPDWFLHETRDRIGEILDRFMVPTPSPAGGDVALFRYGRAASHAAIVIDVPRVIHSYRERDVCYDRTDAQGTMSGRLVGYWTPARWVA